jgi:hypothetical protein
MMSQYIDYNEDHTFLEQQHGFLNTWFDTIHNSIQNLFIEKEREAAEPTPEPDTMTESDSLSEEETIEESESSPEPDTEMNEEPPSETDINEESEQGPEEDILADEEQVPSPLEDHEQSDNPEIDTSIVEYVWTIEDLLRLIWNYETIKVLSRTLEKEEELELSDLFSKCESLIVEQLEELSFEPSELLEVLSSISLLNAVDFNREQIDALLNKLSDTLLRQGLVIVSTLNKLYSSHLALRIGHYYSLTNQRYLVEDLLNKAIEHLSEYYFLPEFVNLKTRGGSAGDGCSILAAADLIILLRDMLVYESGDDFVLLTGILEEWYSSSTPIIASDVVTRSGKINIEIGTSANQHQVEVQMINLPQEIEVHVPHSFSIPMIKVFGAGLASRNAEAASPNIRVVPLSESVVITAHR